MSNGVTKDSRPATIECLKNALLSELKTQVPFYRNCGHRFEALPILSKSLYIERLPDLLSNRLGTVRPCLLELLTKPGRYVQESHGPNGLVIEQTSGSSGVPFTIVKSSAERFTIANAVWSRRREIDGGVSPRNLVALVNNPKAPVKFAANSSPAQAQVSWAELTKIAPRWLHLSPAVLRTLLDWVTKLDLPRIQSLKFIESTGQSLSPELCALAKEALGTTCINSYATREVWTTAVSFSDDGFRVLDDSVFVEIVNTEGYPVSFGEEGRILVTSWHQKLMPFVRYSVGDRGTFMINANGEIRLNLAPHRSHEYLIGAKKPTIGAEVFKVLLKRFFHKYGRQPILYIMFFQSGPTRITMFVNRFPGANLMAEKVAAMFNEMSVCKSPISIDVAQLDDLDVQEKLSREKEQLFSASMASISQDLTT